MDGASADRCAEARAGPARAATSPARRRCARPQSASRRLLRVLLLLPLRHAPRAPARSCPPRPSAGRRPSAPHLARAAPRAAPAGGQDLTWQAPASTLASSRRPSTHAQSRFSAARRPMSRCASASTSASNKAAAAAAAAASAAEVACSCSWSRTSARAELVPLGLGSVPGDDAGAGAATLGEAGRDAKRRSFSSLASWKRSGSTYCSTWDALSMGTTRQVY